MARIDVWILAVRFGDLLPVALRSLRCSWEEDRAGIQGELGKTDVG